MKKIKTALLVALITIAISVLIYFIPTDGLGNRLPFADRFYTNTILEVVAINGKAKVTIDGKDYGETPITVNELNPGDYTIGLERISNTEDFYQNETFSVKLTKNTTSRVEMEIGPAGILHGTILYYTPQNNLDKNRGSLSILSNVEGAKIFLDREYIKSSPIVAYPLDSGTYELEVVATGYETLEIPILVEEDYLLNIQTYLFPIPIIFDGVNNGQ